MSESTQITDNTPVNSGANPAASLRPIVSGISFIDNFSDKPSCIILNPQGSKEDGQRLKAWLEASNITFDLVSGGQGPALRLYGMDGRSEELIGSLIQNGFADNSVAAEYQRLTQAEEARYKKPIEVKLPFAGTKLFEINNKSALDLVGGFAKLQNKSPVKVAGYTYLPPDLIGIAKGAVNSHKMLEPKGLGDYGFSLLALSGTVPMALDGDEYNYDVEKKDGSRLTYTPSQEDMIFAKICGDLKKDKALAELVDRDDPAPRYNFMQSFKRARVSTADFFGRLNNGLSGLAKIYSGSIQNNIFAVMQGSIVFTMFTGSLIAEYFGSAIDSLVKKLPLPRFLKDEWEETMINPHRPIRYVTIHNMIGYATGLWDMYRSPQEIQKIKDEFSGSEFMNIVSVPDGKGGFKLERQGHWYDLFEKEGILKVASDDLRNLLEYSRTGFVAVAEDGSMMPVPAGLHAKLSQNPQGFREIIAGIPYNIMPIPDRDKLSPDVFKKFYKAASELDMYNRLNIAGPMTILEVSGYLLANALYGAVKKNNTPINLDEVISRAAVDLLEREMSGNPETQKDKQKLLLDYYAGKIEQFIESYNKRAERFNAQNVKRKKPEPEKPLIPVLNAAEIAQKIVETAEQLSTGIGNVFLPSSGTSQQPAKAPTHEAPAHAEGLAHAEGAAQTPTPALSEAQAQVPNPHATKSANSTSNFRGDSRMAILRSALGESLHTNAA